MLDDIVGVVSVYTLEELARDNESRFQEGLQPAVGAVEIRPETYVLFRDLMQLNRSGFLTYRSQAGTPSFLRWGVGHVERRAYVHGYATWEKADWLGRAAVKAGLEVTSVAVKELGEDYDLVFPVERLDGEETDETFQVPTRELHEHTVACVTDEAWKDINDNGYHITVIDPVWGREWFLWDTLVHALR